jgi:hypothetical protein
LETNKFKKLVLVLILTIKLYSMKKIMFLLSIPLFYACSNSVKPSKYEVFALPYNNNNKTSWGSSGVDVVIFDMEKGKVKSYERFSN